MSLFGHVAWVMGEASGAEAPIGFAAAAPAVIVALWGVLCLLAARAGLRPWAARALPACGLALALAAALVGASVPLVGEMVGEGALIVDRLAAWFDAVIVAAMLAAVLADAAEGPRGPWTQGMLLLAGAGAMLAVRAGDWGTLIAGLELAVLACGLCLAGAGDAGGRRAARDWLLGQGLGAGILWLGVALVVGATGTTGLHDLGGRVGAVFLRWGANTTQAAVDLLLGNNPLPAGLAAHARDAAVEGMAPAAMFIPGVLLVLAGLLARAGVFPLLAGRTAVAGRTGLAGVVGVELVVRTAAIAALLRVFVSALHVPRVVFAPYGWGTAAAAIGGASVVVCALAAARAADLRRLIAWGGAAQAGLAVLALAAAANFVAHAGLRTGGVQLDESYVWGHGAGEAAVAAVLAGQAIFVLAAAGALAGAGAADGGRGVAGLAGLARRSPLAAASLAVCLLALIGAPPTGGFAARVALTLAIFEDSNPAIRAGLAAGALGTAILGWAYLRALLVTLSPGEGPAPRRAGTLVAAVIAALLLGSGLWGHGWMSMAEEAAAGVAFRPGGKGRREWIVRRDELAE